MRRGKVRFLFDWPCEKGEECADMFESKFRTHGIPFIKDGSSRGTFRIVFWILAAIRAVFNTTKDDLIICWFDFHGILCFIISKILFQKRRILAINILLKEKNTIVNKIVTKLYLWAFSDENFYFTYTSSYMPYSKYDRAFLLYDTYVFRDNLFEKYKDCGNTVFVGGANGRDWSLAVNVAEKLTDVSFTFVMPSKYKSKIKDLGNVSVYYDIDINDYLSLLSKNSIVFLPLETTAPAGLIVLYEAAMKCKALIMTKTIVSADYLNTNTGLMVEMGNVEDACEKISLMINNVDVRRKFSLNLQDKIMQQGSFPNYCNRLFEIIESIDSRYN